MGVISIYADPSNWRRIDAKAVDRWYVGVDLGQSTDPTAICVMHHRVVPHPKWIPDEKRKITRQERSEFFDVKHLERLSLGLAYPVQIQRVADLLTRPPLNALKPKLVIDETGVGRPVGDMFDAAGLRPLRVTITAGSEESRRIAACAQGVVDPDS